MATAVRKPVPVLEPARHARIGLGETGAPTATARVHALAADCGLRAR